MRLQRIQENVRLLVGQRIQRGSMSVSLLARKTGLGQSHVSNFVHGRRNLTLDSLDRVLVATGFSVEIMPDQRTPQPPHPSVLVTRP
jgi:transcriptional regulator with XRE-family HTH domain